MAERLGNGGTTVCSTFVVGGWLELALLLGASRLDRHALEVETMATAMTSTRTIRMK